MLLACEGSLTTFLALPTGACLCRGGGNGSPRAAGQVHHWQSSLEQSQGCLWSIGTLSSCCMSCPEEGNHLHGVAVSPQLLHLGNAAGREEAGAPSLPASKLTICRQCWNRWLFCTHCGTFFPSPKWWSGFFLIFCYWKVVLFVTAAML